MQQWGRAIRILPDIDIMYFKIHSKMTFIVNHEGEREYVL
jgi:DNA-binding LytR/AlgR family response regulator